jgi:hypothetical protein
LAREAHVTISSLIVGNGDVDEGGSATFKADSTSSVASSVGEYGAR